MVSAITLVNYLKRRNPYPCLSVLESAVVCCRRSGTSMIPAPLLEDIASLHGKETTEKEIKNLEEMAILERTDEGISLNNEVLPLVSDQIRQLKKNLKLTLAGKEQTAGIFLKELVAYLQQKVSELVVAEAIDGAEYLLVWSGKKYRLQLAFSPAWLPAAAEEAAAENSYVAILGPFVAQNWLKMFRYYEYPEFRNYTAYFDPWCCQKMNISKGGLFTYFDWFFRDNYGLKFFIPDEFIRGLQDIGLLRYNDER